MEDIYNYMIWGNYNKRMEDLAAIVIPEQWSFGDSNDNAILKNYLKYTFWKLREENKIVANDKF